MSREQKKNIVVFSFSGILLLCLMIFTDVRNNGRAVDELNVEVVEEDGVYFTDELEVIDLMTDSTDFLIGSKVGTIDPKTLETRVEANPFVRDAQVYRDVRGKLLVDVVQSKPIARVFIDGISDRYIDSEGRVLPVNARHTARVPLVETTFEFKWEEHMHESAFGVQLFELLTYIEKDPFWKAQIAHVLVKNDGELELYPQVTKQKIVFGKPEDFEEKFSKLMTFYKEILPKKGWNHYTSVNLKFEDQIICE